MEKAIQSMQKKIHELAQKLIEYTPQPTLQPFSPPQAQVCKAMQPATLFHSVSPASSHHVNESSTGKSAPIPIAPLSTKYDEMSAVEIPNEKLKTIAETLQKFNSLCTESKIGVLAVKLAREAIFGDVRQEVRVTCQCCHKQSLISFLKCTLFGQFSRAQKSTRRIGQLHQRYLPKRPRDCGKDYDSDLFAVSRIQKRMYKKPFNLCHKRTQ